MDDAKSAADTARVIQSGDTQVVELPSGYAFDTGEVSIRRDGNAFVLEPIEDEWSSFPRLPDDLADELLAAVEEEVPQQERPELNDWLK